jgi:hemerythrin-like domain-containing protein
MKYEVTYTTLIRRHVEVEADSLTHALERVTDMLRDNVKAIDKESFVQTEDRNIVSVRVQTDS